MHVQYVAICEQVIIGADGKPSLIGVFNDVQAPSLPITLPRIAFVARILFTEAEVGRSYKVEVAITDPNGVEIGRPGGDMTLPPALGGVDSIAADLPMQFDLFGITTFGRYTFVLEIDGKKTSAVQVSVRQAPQNVA
jgi:hypothetical protein